METAEKELTKVFGVQSSGKGGNFEMEIHMSISREYNQTDNRNIRKCADELEKAIRGESIHLDPKEKETANEERTKILELFNGHVIFVEEIPNGYCSDYCCKHLPWFMVTTKAGHIKIGWRKRVIEIEWKKTLINQTAEELFTEEKVTKQNKLIHAWGYEKAKEYINVLLNYKN